MDDNNSHNEIKKTGDLNVKMSAGNDKIKYYNCSDNNCMFEIISSADEINKNNESQKFNASMNYNSQDELDEYPYIDECKSAVSDGKIIVKSILDCANHEVIEGVKINLYKINGLSPMLIESKITNNEGKVIFSDLDQGCYRIIEIIDKRYFEKPKYVNWNEIIINEIDREKQILVVNKIKSFRK